MKITVHGCRGSFPISVPASRIEEISRSVWEFAKKRRLNTWKEIKTALETEPHSLHQIYGGSTTCLELKSPKAPMPIFLDAGTGLTHAGLDPDSALGHHDFKTGKGKAAFFISHTHWDHIIGLPTIDQLYRVGNEFHFYSVHAKMNERIAALFQEEHFPVPYRVVEKNFIFHQIKLGEKIKFGDLEVSHCPQPHPGGSFAYRFHDGEKSFVFATDTELKNISEVHDKAVHETYSDADLIYLDAQYSPEDIATREGYGHSSIYNSVDFAIRMKVKKVLLTHHNPAYDDHMVDEQLFRAKEYLFEKYGEETGIELRMAIEGHSFEI